MELILNDIRHIIAITRERVARSVNHELTVAYWQIGQRIVEEEQQGKERAKYKTFLLTKLSEVLVTDLSQVKNLVNRIFLQIYKKSSKQDIDF